MVECTSCGHIWDRGINAAKNIKYFGLREYDGLYRPRVFTQRMDVSHLPNDRRVEILINLIDESINNN
jgi:transposase